MPMLWSGSQHHLTPFSPKCAVQKKKILFSLKILINFPWSNNSWLMAGNTLGALYLSVPALHCACHTINPFPDPTKPGISPARTSIHVEPAMQQMGQTWLCWTPNPHHS